jgi:hypothetical protein
MPCIALPRISANGGIPNASGGGCDLDLVKYSNAGKGLKMISLIM